MMFLVWVIWVVFIGFFFYIEVYLNVELEKGEFMYDL